MSTTGDAAIARVAANINFTWFLLTCWKKKRTSLFRCVAGTRLCLGSSACLLWVLSKFSQCHRVFSRRCIATCIEAKPCIRGGGWGEIPSWGLSSRKWELPGVMSCLHMWDWARDWPKHWLCSVSNLPSMGDTLLLLHSSQGTDHPVCLLLMWFVTFRLLCGLVGCRQETAPHQASFLQLVPRLPPVAAFAYPEDTGPAWSRKSRQDTDPRRKKRPKNDQKSTKHRFLVDFGRFLVVFSRAGVYFWSISCRSLVDLWSISGRFFPMQAVQLQVVQVDSLRWSKFGQTLSPFWSIFRAKLPKQEKE